MASSEFDFLQEEFLSKRHMVEKLQDRLDSEILNAKNANLPGDIRDGIK